MQLIDAKLRHRELTQAVYDIGDEVVDYIEHLIEAINDWDTELVVDCKAEFDDIVEDARVDARRAVAELAGVRQALTSGLRSGTVSVRQRRDVVVAKPAVLTDVTEVAPLSSPAGVEKVARAMKARSRAVVRNLEATVEWVLDRTAVAADDLGALSLPVLYSQTQRIVDVAVETWMRDVAQLHPEFVRGMRGSKPPRFLGERARIDAVVARVIAKRKVQAS
ncbi:hypothetical protein [Corynebacterium epidermidicanis]|uniref:Uncharacterized protein n=1 Tax=Corynebacterium epidermidicanis TaxID=1050174 RepID=A0A0G3GRB1_9CORY|nr:hypothetical protein [Corynebacterium epidermidicanis]AKK03639.1 hypothetical protein CEPID_08965 [Corynebacterium epidermidicanis]